MPTTPEHPRRSDAVVHLHLDGDVGGHPLRERLVPCLASDASDVRVHVGAAGDLDGDVLRTLGAAAAVLEERGGALTVVGAGERLRTRLWLHGIQRLVAEEPAAGHPGGVAQGEASARG